MRQTLRSEQRSIAPSTVPDMMALAGAVAAAKRAPSTSQTHNQPLRQASEDDNHTAHHTPSGTTNPSEESTYRTSSPSHSSKESPNSSPPQLSSGSQSPSNSTEIINPGRATYYADCLPGPHPFQQEDDEASLLLPHTTSPKPAKQSIFQTKTTIKEKSARFVREVQEDPKTRYAIEKTRAGAKRGKEGPRYEPEIQVSGTIESNVARQVREKMKLCSREEALASGKHRLADYVIRERQRTLARLEGEM